MTLNRKSCYHSAITDEKTRIQNLNIFSKCILCYFHFRPSAAIFATLFCSHYAAIPPSELPGITAFLFHINQDDRTCINNSLYSFHIRYNDIRNFNNTHYLKSFAIFYFVLTFNQISESPISPVYLYTPNNKTYSA